MVYDYLSGVLLHINIIIGINYPGKGKWGRGWHPWEFLMGGVPPGSPNPGPILDQKMSSFRPVFRPGLRGQASLTNYIDDNSNKKDFLKAFLNSHTALSFLLIPKIRCVINLRIIHIPVCTLILPSSDVNGSSSHSLIASSG